MGADVGATTYLPFCFQYLVEYLNTQSTPSFLIELPQNPLFILLALYAVITIVTKTAAFLHDMLFYPVINLAIREGHFKIGAHMHDIALDDYNKFSIPEIISYQKRLWMGARFFLRSLLVSIIPTLLKFGFAFYIVWSLNIFREILLLGLVAMIVVFYLALSWYLRIRYEAWTIADSVTLSIGDSIFNTKRVRFHKSFEFKRLRAKVQEEAKYWFSMTIRMDMTQVVLGLIIALLTIVLIGGCAVAIENKTMTVGQLVLLNGQLAAFFIPMRQMLLDMRQMCEASVDFDKIAELFSIPVEKKETVPFTLPNDINAAHTKEWLRCEDVTFTYKNHHPLFQKLNLSLKMGETTLLFGKSGVGKSSALGLITGLLTPQTGKIFLFDQDISRLSLEDIGKVVHFIPQENPLFSGTIWENITFGMENVDEKNVMEALSLMQLDSLVQGLPQGIHTPIGEKGAMLSGGEKQRIALAHALLLRPLILIFDETLNAMDPSTEERVFSVIREKIPTLLFISHKKTDHVGVDRVLELTKKGHESAMLLENNTH